ncbi:hypothetical protein BJ165DRAFT_1410804, partial [Panaeolus papilionaceus]
MSPRNESTQRSTSETQHSRHSRSTSQTPGSSGQHSGPSGSTQRSSASSFQAPPEPYILPSSGNQSDLPSRLKSIVEKAEIIVSEFRKSQDPSARLKSIGMLYSIFELRDKEKTTSRGGMDSTISAINLSRSNSSGIKLSHLETRSPPEVNPSQ